MIRNSTLPAQRDEKVARATAMMRVRIAPSDDYGDTMFEPDFVNEIFKSVNLLISKDRLLEYFEASVYPTKDEVALFLSERFPKKESFFSSEFALIDELIHKKMNPDNQLESSPEYPLSNTYMMKYFPGIHYNVVCREVGRQCYPRFQRTLSGIQEAEREGREYPIAVTKTFAQLKADIEEIVTRRLGSFKQKSIDLKKYLSEQASNIYMLPTEQKQELFDYLRAKGYIRANTAMQTINSNVMKYFIRPNLYRIQAGGRRTRKQKQSKRKTQKNLKA